MTKTIYDFKIDNKYLTADNITTKAQANHCYDNGNPVRSQAYRQSVIKAIIGNNADRQALYDNLFATFSKVKFDMTDYKHRLTDCYASLDGDSCPDISLPDLDLLYNAMVVYKTDCAFAYALDHNIYAVIADYTPDLSNNLVTAETLNSKLCKVNWGGQGHISLAHTCYCDNWSLPTDLNFYTILLDCQHNLDLAFKPAWDRFIIDCYRNRHNNGGH